MAEKNFYKVEGYPGFVKNPSTGTILNQNIREIENARARKMKRKSKESNALRLEEEVSTMKEEMKEIKTLLRQLLEK
jgi:hypothetical protein